MTAWNPNPELLTTLRFLFSSATNHFQGHNVRTCVLTLAFCPGCRWGQTRGPWLRLCFITWPLGHSPPCCGSCIFCWDHKTMWTFFSESRVLSFTPFPSGQHRPAQWIFRGTWLVSESLGQVVCYREKVEQPNPSSATSEACDSLPSSVRADAMAMSTQGCRGHQCGGCTWQNLAHSGCLVGTGFRSSTRWAVGWLVSRWLDVYGMTMCHL